MRAVWWFLLACMAARSGGDLFRTDLFPEQLEQQRLQFRQADIQLRIQQIQSFKQLANGPQLEELVQEELNLQSESWRIQQEILRLQADLQRRLSGEKVNFIPAVFQPFPSQTQFPQTPVPVQQFPQQPAVPVQQFPQQPVPAQQFPQQPFPAQQFPQQPVPSQQFPQQPVPAQQFPQQPDPAQQFPQQPVPAQQFPQQPVPAQQFPQQPVPAQQFPQQPVPAPQFPQQPAVQVQPQQPFPTQEAFFPQPTQPEQEIDNNQINNNFPDNPSCTIEGGEAGICKPLIKCLTFYADLSDLRRHPCALGPNGQQGVCCPLKSILTPGSGGGPSKSGILKSPTPPPVPIPPLTMENLDTAAHVGINSIKQREQFLDNLLARGITVRPGTAAKWHQDFFPTTNETLVVGDEAQKSLVASKALVDEFTLTPDQGKFALPKFTLLNTVLADTCPRFVSCVLHKYRSFDGSCNNVRNPHWGQAGTALQRILPPNYADGVNAPRTGKFGPLPSARLVSSFFATDVEAPSNNYSMMVMQWGQFMDHDLTHTPISRGAGGTGISCCRDGKVIPQEFQHPDCFPIELPRNDKIFAPFGERCMEFARSLPAPRPECNFGPREQMNQISGYLDGSNIYGSNVDTARSLRLGRGGFLRAQNVRGRAYLPANRGECTDRTNTLSCFQAGDGRVNEQVDLALMHTIWLREHNRIASVLQRFHPDWSDEALYQEARRIVIAEVQHITYNEYLPILLGPEYMQRSELTPKESGWTQFYDPDLNGGITNSFATAAFRFGHSQIQSFLHGYGRFGNIRENMELSKQHFAPFVLYKEGAIDDFIRGLAGQPAQTVDRHFSNQITDHLFQGNLDIGLDLFSLNLQRGRDHGLAPYNDWREVCGLRRAVRWEDLEEHMDPSSILVISRLYLSIDDIDLYTGAIAEKAVPGAVLGPTFQCLIGDQFARLKRGDRFFYEEGNQPSSFTSQQLKEIRKVTLARILCDNSDDIVRFQPWAFLQPAFINQKLNCNTDAIPFVDLRAWLNERPAVP